MDKEFGVLEWGAAAAALMALVRLGEWFVRGQIARARTGNGKSGNGKYYSKHPACVYNEADRTNLSEINTKLKALGPAAFGNEDSRRLLEAAGNSYKIMEFAARAEELLSKTDAAGIHLIYRPPQWEEAMTTILTALKDLNASVAETAKNVRETTNQIEKNALIQQGVIDSQKRIETKLERSSR